MKKILLTISIILVAVVGCSNIQKNLSINESHCQKFGEFLKYLREEDAQGRLCVSENEEATCHVDDWEELEIALFAASGCTPPCEILSNGWQDCLTLGQIWPEMSSGNVRQIYFCHSVEARPDEKKWYDDFEVPKKAIPGMVKLLGKALDEAEKRGIKWGSGIDSVWYTEKRMKIDTNKNTYLIPVSWNNKAIYGNDWTSPDLREYLRKLGFRW